MDVAEMAVDTLADWLNGHFTPADGPQLRVRIHDITDAVITVSVEECNPFPDNERMFRIRVTAEEAT